MKIKIVSLFVLFLFLAACSTMPAEEIEDIKSKIVEANMGVNSFKFKTDNDIGIKGPDGEMNMKLSAEGAMDRNAKALMIKGNMDMKQLSGEASEIEDVSMPIETYSDGEWIYTSTMGQWIKMGIDADIFNEQDQAKYLTEFLESGEVHAEDFVLDGKEVYKVDVKPSNDALVKLASKNSPVPLQEMGDISNLFSNMKITYYINKDDYLAQKSEISYDITFGEELGNLVMKNDMTFEMYNINQPVEIDIPEEAKDAIDFAELQKSMLQASENLPEDLEVPEGLDVDDMESFDLDVEENI